MCELYSLVCIFSTCEKWYNTNVALREQKRVLHREMTPQAEGEAGSTKGREMPTLDKLGYTEP